MYSKVAVYTVIIDRFDSLKDHVYWEDCVDYFLITNTPGEHGPVEKKYNVIHVEDTGLDPRRASRLPKILAHRFLPEYDCSLYIDANLILMGPVKAFVEWAVSEDPLAVLPSADSHQLSEQLERCIAGRKDDPELMRAQVQGYFDQGFPEDHPVFSGAILIRRHNDPMVVRAMDVWWEEVLAQSARDQLSYCFAVWKTGILHFRIEAGPKDVLRRTTHGLRPELLGGPDERINLPARAERQSRWGKIVRLRMAQRLTGILGR